MAGGEEMGDAISHMLTVVQVACQQDVQEDKQRRCKASPSHRIYLITAGSGIGVTIDTRGYCSLSGF